MNVTLIGDGMTRRQTLGSVVRSGVDHLFDLLFKGIKGRARKTIYRVCNRISDRILGNGNYDQSRNGERWFLRRLARVLSSGVVLDVGAHHGEWAKVAHEANRSWTIHCFEPETGSFVRLAASGDVREFAILHKMGFSDAKGVAPIKSYLHDGVLSSAMTSLYDRRTMMASERVAIQTISEVELDTVDNFCGANAIDQVTLLKIDTEGNELRVLEGATEMLRGQRIAALQFEYDASWIDSRSYLFDAYQLLRIVGYRVFKITPEGLIHISRYAPFLEDYRFSNFVGLRSDVPWPVDLTCMEL